MRPRARRVTDLRAEADRHVAELDSLIDAAVPSVTAEAKRMNGVVAASMDVSALSKARDSITQALHNVDLTHGVSVTAGFLVAAAALGAAQGRGQKTSGWPSYDGIKGRTYWQGLAGWTDDEYANIVVEANRQATLSHGKALLDFAEFADTEAQTSLARLHGSGHGQDHEHSVTEQVQHHLEEIELIGELLTRLKEAGERKAEDRAGLIADVEGRAFHAQEKFIEQTEDAGDDCLVYCTKEDSKVRHSHAILDLKAWPANSPVWKHIYPPNGVHCRCAACRRSRKWVLDNLGASALPAAVPKGGHPDKGFDELPGVSHEFDWSVFKESHIEALYSNVSDLSMNLPTQVYVVLDRALHFGNNAPRPRRVMRNRSVARRGAILSKPLSATP